jgi:hypothetical protein
MVGIGCCNCGGGGGIAPIVDCTCYDSPMMLATYYVSNSGSYPFPPLYGPFTVTLSSSGGMSPLWTSGYFFCPDSNNSNAYPTPFPSGNYYGWWVNITVSCNQFSSTVPVGSIAVVPANSDGSMSSTSPVNEYATSYSFNCSPFAASIDFLFFNNSYPGIIPVISFS